MDQKKVNPKTMSYHNSKEYESITRRISRGSEGITYPLREIKTNEREGYTYPLREIKTKEREGSTYPLRETLAKVREKLRTKRSLPNILNVYPY